MISRNRRWPSGLLLGVVLFPCGAGAQTVDRSFDEPQQVLKVGQLMVATKEAGRETEGQADRAASGQEADPFTSLRSATKPGDRVRIIDRSGRSTTGRLVAVLPSTIRLMSRGITREMPRDDIAVIRRDGDSLWNGAAWGAAIGAVVALNYISHVDCRTCSTAETASVPMVLGGIGAGLGALLDLTVRDERVLYRDQQAGLIVERPKDSFVVAPDLKVSRVNDTFAGLAGVYGGRLIHKTFLIGAGGYWLTNGHDKLKMRYGGLVLGWQPPAEHRFAFVARGLLGFGAHDSWLSTESWQMFIPSGFVVAEPQADLRLTLTDRFRLNGGIGYRLVGADETDRLGGITASLALQFGGGS